MDQAATPEAAQAATARARRAGNLLNTGRFDQALAEYDWLWRHLHHLAPDMAGVRISFTASEIGHLCRQHPPAQDHFERVRDQTEAAIGNSGDAPSLEIRLDWMVLNEIVGQAERSLLWFEGVDLDGLPDAFVDRCIPRLVPPLRRRGRWADIGRLFRQPLARLREDHATMVHASAQKSNRPSFGRMSADDLLRDLFREQTTILYRGLRAAGRGDEAAAVRQEALALDPSPEMRENLPAETGEPGPTPSGGPAIAAATRSIRDV